MKRTEREGGGNKKKRIEGRIERRGKEGKEEGRREGWKK